MTVLVAWAVQRFIFNGEKSAHFWLVGMGLRSIFLVLVLLPLCQISAQEAIVFKPDPVKKKLEAVAISSPLKIDGVLDEPSWKRAKPSPRFTQIEPNQGAPPTQDTEIKVLFDKNNLYFGIVCHDSLGKDALRATDFKRDFDFRTHDLVTLCFDGFNDERNAMSIVVNPYGVQRDYLSFDAIYYDIEWDGLWKTRTTRTDTGWVAEIAIPWKTLRYPNTGEQAQSWGFQLYRNRRLTNEITAFSAFPRSFNSARMDYAGELTNLRPPPPQSNIIVQPYFLTSYKQTKGSNSDVESETTDVKVGGELKWAVNPNAVLDVTVNTDFAQAEVDRQVNNTSRFSVFFPERRQFFLENASLFGINVRPGSGSQGGSMRVQPFFSRRIGLDDQASPIPIDAGGRFVNRSTQRNYGAILMRQRGDSLTPATNFFVGRYSENFGKQNRIGTLITTKNRPDNTNITGTIDAFVRFGESHSLNTLLSYSGNTEVGGNGFSGIAQYFYSTNTWKGWWTQSVVTENFDPALGFISRNDVIGTTPGLIHYFRGERLPFKKWLRAFEPSVFAQFYHRASTGRLIERQLGAFPFYLNLQNGGYFGYGVNLFFQRLTEAFSPLEVPIGVGTYDYVQHTLLASTDPSKKFNINGTVNFGSYFNGRLDSYDIQAKYAPLPHISLGAGLNRVKFGGVGINSTDKTVDLYNLEGRFAWNPRIQLSAFYQSNSENNRRNLNIRFSWEYRPLSFIYLVFNDQDFNDTLLGQRTERQAIAKISYLKQF
ncbi:DUF5916 domain-containing protein [Spongiimicrobium sp. 2-473A-2-J]|uniref:DUF5916 domain-containing protein n=1 Tax=Eudoraea algarum TaxID=3417568 RepID=UPI003D36B9CE